MSLADSGAALELELDEVCDCPSFVLLTPTFHTASGRPPVSLSCHAWTTMAPKGMSPL